MKKIIYKTQNEDTTVINSENDLTRILEESENVVARHRDSHAIFFITLGNDDCFELNYKELEGAQFDNVCTSFETLMDNYDLIAISDKELASRLFD